MIDIEKIQEELAAAIKFVEESQQQLAEGNVMVLTDLQTNVGKICETIANLPIDKGMAYREQMLELSQKMENLEIDLRAKKIEVERELRSANSNKSATTAYQKAQLSGQEVPADKEEK